jgi:hypothetical protein
LSIYLPPVVLFADGDWVPDTEVAMLLRDAVDGLAHPEELAEASRALEARWRALDRARLLAGML